MSESNVSNNLIKYINNNHISIAELAEKTGISPHKFEQHNIIFEASEFLEICAYLNINPESMI